MKPRKGKKKPKSQIVKVTHYFDKIEKPGSKPKGTTNTNTNTKTSTNSYANATSKQKKPLPNLKSINIVAEEDEEEEIKRLLEQYPQLREPVLKLPAESLPVPAAPPSNRKLTTQEILAKQKEFRTELFKLLKIYFKAVVTIIIKRRRLCPSDGFQMARVLDVKVPQFVHPSSVEYLEEVITKLLTFLHRNTAQGCVLHISVDKSKTAHVVQRFVFKFKGQINSEVNSRNNDLYLEAIKVHLRNSLMRVLTSTEIKPIQIPPVSRWSISIGLKPEFVNLPGFYRIWDSDPNGSFFPWREKPKFSASAGLDLELEQSQQSQSQYPATPDSQLGSSGSQYYLKRLLDEGKLTLKDLEEQDTDEDVDDDDEDEDNGIEFFPLSDIPVCDNFVITLFGLTYPAPEISLTPTPMGTPVVPPRLIPIASAAAASPSYSPTSSPFMFNKINASGSGSRSVSSSPDSYGRTPSPSPRSQHSHRHRHHHRQHSQNQHRSSSASSRLAQIRNRALRHSSHMNRERERDRDRDRENRSLRSPQIFH